MIPKQMYESPRDNRIMPLWTVLGSSVGRVSKLYSVHKMHIPDIGKRNKLLMQR